MSLTPQPKPMDSSIKARLKEIFEWRTDPHERMRIWSDGTTTLHKEGKVTWVFMSGTPAMSRKEFESAGGFD